MLGINIIGINIVKFEYNFYDIRIQFMIEASNTFIDEIIFIAKPLTVSTFVDIQL